MRRTPSPLPVLALLLALAALAGCNSHAVFPYDQNLCGNGQLDENEPCDFDDEFGGIRINGDLCHDIDGYVGGTPGCENCRLVYEGFCFRRADCNAFDGNGCPEGDACYFFPESHLSGCAPAGDRPPGNPCDDSSQCHPMSLCQEIPGKGKICVQICDNQTACPGEPCEHPQGFPEPMGYCPPMELECDPITNNLCMAPLACYFIPDGDPRVQCVESDPGKVEGEPCSSPFDCLPTLTCHEGTCRVLCNLAGECAPNHQCEEDVGFADYGVCMLYRSCDPVINQGCRGGLICNFMEDGGLDRYCGFPGQVAEGEGCTPGTHECHPGLFCSSLLSVDGSSICTPLCSDRQTCLSGNVCALASSDFLPGLCVTPTFCDPLFPDQCGDGRMCTIINDLGDTACLYPGPSQPGDQCNLFHSCVAGAFCDNQGGGNRVCRHLCDKNTTTECPTGGLCTEMFWTAIPTVGVCK